MNGRLDVTAEAEPLQAVPGDEDDDLVAMLGDLGLGDPLVSGDVMVGGGKLDAGGLGFLGNHADAAFGHLDPQADRIGRLKGMHGGPHGYRAQPWTRLDEWWRRSWRAG